MAEQTGKFSSQISANWLAQIIRPFLRHQSQTWLDGAAAECAKTILFYLDNEPEDGPDWSDLRDMARKAGWSVRTEPVGLRPVETKIWAHYPPGDRYPDGSRGWARVAYGRGGACRMSVEMHAPGRDPRSRVDLVDPTPAEILTAARLLGLVGGVS